MTDEELIKVYEDSYNGEYKRLFDIGRTFYEQSKDKQYALQLGLGIIQFMYAFRSKSELENRITKTYEHIDKLGGSILDIIRITPSLIEEQKELSEKWHAENKSKIKPRYKKILGIPYWINGFNFNPKIRMGSPFEDLEFEEEIAKELAKQRAIIDVVNEFKNQYSSYPGIEDVKSEILKKLKNALEQNDLDKFFTIVQGVFANMPYDMKVTEGYFHSHIHLLLFLLGFEINSEVETNKGRIDSVIETAKYVHIIEFKQNSSKLAIEQIKEKEYYQKYFLSEKEIVLVGVAIDTKDKNIKSWKIQLY